MTKRIISMLLLAGILLTIFTPSVTSSSVKEYYLKTKDIKYEKIEPVNEKIELELYVKGNVSKIDIYIMTLSDYSNNMFLERNFTNETIMFSHNVYSCNITFEPEDDDDYVIVMDNSDNYLSNDTVPDEDVRVMVRIKYTKSAKPMTIKGLIISFLALVFIVYSLVLYRRKVNRIREKEKRIAGEVNEEKQ